MYDYLLKNGKVVDGTGNPWRRADIAVSNDTIVGIGTYTRATAKRVLDLDGLYVAPGLIDVHSHADFQPLVEPSLQNALLQGITTQIIGNCGDSAAPFSFCSTPLNWLDPFSRNYTLTWGSVAEYMDALSEARPYTNLGLLVGHGRLRNEVMGCDNRPPSTVELNEMKSVLEESMLAGAFGMSTGLGYPPGDFADTQELIELAHVLANHGGIYVSHTRDQYALSAFEEIIRIGREAKIPVHISHFKSVEGLKLLFEAREQGIDITYDLYPYNSGSGYLLGVMPTWLYEYGQDKILERLREQTIREKVKQEMQGHKWDGRFIVSLPGDQALIGKSIQQLAEERDVHPVDFACDLLLQEGLNVMTIGFFGGKNGAKDVETLIKNELHMVSSDAIETPRVYGSVHPRTYGAFARIIAKYVKEEIIPLSTAIWKMTAFPACRFGLVDRGLISKGKQADIFVFDLERFADRATLENPRCHPKGIKLVMVNGQIVVEDGEIVGSGSGRVLKKPNSNGVI